LNYINEKTVELMSNGIFSLFQFELITSEQEQQSAGAAVVESAAA
jgi:hypothetical protein